jgi:cell division protein FtsN
MTHDFAKPSSTRKPAAKSTRKGSRPKPKPTSKQAPAHKPGRIRIALSLTVLITLFAGGLYLLQSVPPAATGTETVTAPASKPTTVTKTVTTAPTSKQESSPKFEFYDILPRTEVETTDIDAYKFKERAREKPYHYMIQTGSFRSAADAERQKATIAFQGLKARIDVVQNTQGSTWHRVSTGPFHDRSQMNSALDKLVALNIEPLVKKVESDK